MTRSLAATASDDPPRSVDVYVSIDTDDVLAGRLYSHVGRGIESATFIYAPSYLADPHGYALEPALPLDASPHHTDAGLSMFRSFADTAPDRWGRRLILRAERLRADQQQAPARALSEFMFVLGVRDDLRQGALRFRAIDSGAFMTEDDTGVPPLTELPKLLDLAGRVEQDDALLDELRTLLRAGSSLGGARPKAHVRAPDGRVAIAKFPSESADTWNVMAWEKTTLDLAAMGGIAVPPNALLDIAGRSVLIVDRFDRTENRRVGYISALTMLEARDGDVGTYLDIAAAIEEHSPATTEDLHQLWRRMAFTVLVSNTDDHLRNHGFLHAGDDSWVLAPAFDLNPNPGPGPKVLATAIGDPGDTRASIASLMRVATLFRLSDDAARAVLRDVVTATRTWRNVAASNGLSARDCRHMGAAFEHEEVDVARQLAQN